MSNLQTIRNLFQPVFLQIPPANLKNLWLTLCGVVALQSLLVFNTTQITGNAITALIVWGGALICMEDQIEDLRPNPSHLSLLLGTALVTYTLYRLAVIQESDSLLYLLAPTSGLGLVLLAKPIKKLLDFKDSLLVLSLLPIFVVTQIVVATHVTDDLSVTTARFVMFWISLLGITPAKLIDNTVFVGSGAVQVMHECNGFEMIMQMIITAFIFSLAFPLRSRIGRFVIICAAPIIGLVINSIRIALLAVFTSSDSDSGRMLFKFFHEQAGSLIFSGIAVFLFGYLYYFLLDRELPPIIHE